MNINNKVFNKAYLPFLDAMERVQIFFGGSSSGKSVFLSQRCVLDILRGGRNYLVVRNVARTIRGSVFKEICKVIADWNVGKLFKINKSEMTITCQNGYQIIFTGLDDVEKLKSITAEKGVITDIWVEEATETKPDDLKQLGKRLRGITKGGIKKRIHLSFNPIIRTHWIYKMFFKGFSDNMRVSRKKGLLIFKTTYKDNRFLEPDDIKELEGETDEYFRSVYTLGIWGILGDVIFKNWKVEDLTELIPKFDNIRNGLDFGFTNSPTAYNRWHYNKAKKTLYIFDEIHEKGLTNPEIADKLKPILGEEVVVCDSEDPKSIEELQQNGIEAVGAVKGKDSVRHGIQWIQQQTVIIHTPCQETINTFQYGQWKKGADGENSEEPMKKYKHHIDAVRYGSEGDMVKEDEDWIEVGVYDF